MHLMVLASQSPRRRELLDNAGFKFLTHPVEVSEILEKNLNLGAAVEQLSRLKAEVAASELNHMKSQDILVLSGDTVVVHGGEVLGKPATKAQAVEFLSRLSASQHQVVTALTLLELASGKVVSGHEVTAIAFRPLAMSEIQAYVATGEPMDKAGAYGIQGAASEFVSWRKGPLDNVVGLPLGLLNKMLEENGWTVERK